MVWPFPAGSSPFRIKGAAYRGHLQYVSRELPGGLPAMLEAIEPSHVPFFQEGFLANRWYDIWPLVAAATPCARLAGRDVGEFLQARSRWQAKQDVKGIYRSFVRILSNRTVATQLPRLFGLYLDFVRTEVEEVEDGVLRATLHGVPAAMAGWFATIFPSYMETILEVGGFDAGPLPLRGPGPDGEAHGVRTVWLGFRMALRSPPR